MPWRTTDPMHERMKFVSLYEEQLYSVSELCRRFGISRETGYKWVRRYEEEGAEGLKDRSRAPKHCPHRTSADVEAALLAVRAKHPTWGPRKILAYLARRRPTLPLPAASTVGELLARQGLTQPRRRRRNWKHPGEVPLVTSDPNEVWTADYKGQFKTQDGVYCFPLTVADAHTRFLLGVDALLSTKQVEARPVFERLFREYGLPGAIRTDNGVPFATQAIAGLSVLSVWWIKLGIQHQRIEPASPQQNGAHERMHKTLKAETTRPPQKNRAAQQGRFEGFRGEFNQERPHEALQMQTPASLYAPSGRPMPERIPAPEYPGHYLVRRVSRAGTFRFKNRQLFLSDALIQEPIGLEEIEDGLWSLYFCQLLLARLDERDFRLRG